MLFFRPEVSYNRIPDIYGIFIKTKEVIKMSRNNTHAVQKLAVAGVLTAVAVVGSFLSVPTMVGNRHRILCKPDP